jgi:hypothetical protein
VSSEPQAEAKTKSSLVKPKPQSTEKPATKADRPKATIKNKENKPSHKSVDTDRKCDKSLKSSSLQITQKTNQPTSSRDSLKETSEPRQSGSSPSTQRAQKVVDQGLSVPAQHSPENAHKQHSTPTKEPAPSCSAIRILRTPKYLLHAPKTPSSLRKEIRCEPPTPDALSPITNQSDLSDFSFSDTSVINSAQKYANAYSYL